MLISSIAFSSETLKWENLPELPLAKNQLYQPGLAGAFIGIHNNVLNVVLMIIIEPY